MAQLGSGHNGTIDLQDGSCLPVQDYGYPGVALQRTNDPAGEPPPVTLRGFSWIVSPADEGGVLLHVEMQLGTVSAGPFTIGEARLTDMVSRVIGGPRVSTMVH